MAGGRHVAAGDVEWAADINATINEDASDAFGAGAELKVVADRR